jgi:O-Antigen ligase
MQPKGLIIAVPLALAGALSLFILTSDTWLSLRIIVGISFLVVAFVSTRISLYLLVFSMLLSPEFLVGELTGGGGATGRGLTLRFDDFLLVVFGFVWLAKMAIHKGGTPFLRTPLNGPIMFYIAAAGLATLIGVLGGRVKPLTGFFYWLKYYEYVFLYFMVVSAVTTKEETRGLVIVSLVTCCLVSLFAIAQIPGGERASAPFEGEQGEPNTLGGYLVFMLAIVVGLLLTNGVVTNRLPLLLLLAAGTVGLAATLSRASFLAAGVVILGVIVFVAPRRPILVSMVLLGVLSAPLWAPHAVKERVLYTFTQAEEEGQMHLGTLTIDTSTSDRLRSWHDSFQIWQKFPLWGTGITGGPFIDAMYPRVLTETGMLGLVTFLVLIGSIFRMSMASYRLATDEFSRGLALGFLLGFLALLVHAIGSNTFLIVRIMEPFWLFAALVVRGLLISQTVEPSVREAGALSIAARAAEAARKPAFGRSRFAKPNL